MLYCRKRDILDRVEKEINEEKLQMWNSYYLGNGPPLQMETFAENRKRLMKEMSEHSRLSFIFLEGKTVSDGDIEKMVEPFTQEENFFWTFGVLEPNFCGAIDILNEKTYLFFPKDCFPEFHKGGESSSIQKYIKKKYMTDFAEDLESMTTTLQNLNYNLAYALPNNVPGHLISPKTLSKLEKIVRVDNEKLLPVITKLRMVKSRNEIEVIRYLSKVASIGLRFVMDSTLPGMSEYKLMALFSDYVLRSGGCRIVANKTSCFSSSSLRNYVHYSHLPSWDGVFKDGELCLLDVCCSYFGYITTVSITFPVSGRLSAEQEKMYRIVLNMREAILKELSKDVTVAELNTVAKTVLLSHLKSDFDILNHPIEDCLRYGLGDIFMPMKSCRLIGLGVEDLEELESRQLSEGCVLAVAPGCYFADQLIDRALTWKRGYIRDSVNSLRDLGGVRLTDVVLITGRGYQLLTDLPRSLRDLENCLSASAQDRIPFSSFVSCRPSSQTQPIK